MTAYTWPEEPEYQVIPCRECGADIDHDGHELTCSRPCSVCGVAIAEHPLTDACALKDESCAHAVNDPDCPHYS
jgi:hypothetical protein